jgi:hypothetical protein
LLNVVHIFVIAGDHWSLARVQSLVTALPEKFAGTLGESISPLCFVSTIGSQSCDPDRST